MAGLKNNQKNSARGKNGGRRADCRRVAPSREGGGRCLPGRAGEASASQGRPGLPSTSCGVVAAQRIERPGPAVKGSWSGRLAARPGATGRELPGGQRRGVGAVSGQGNWP